MACPGDRAGAAPVRSDTASPPFRAVPFELALEPQGQHAERYPLGEGTGHVEIRAGRLAAFAGADPVAIMPRRPGQKFAGEVVILHLFDWQQARVFAISAGGDET